MRKHDPTQFLPLRLKSFGKAASPLVVVGDDGHSCFGLGAAGLTPTKVRVGFLFGQLRGGARADVINEARIVFGEASLHFLITKSTVRDNFLKLLPDGFFGGFQRAQEKLGVGADVFKKFPVDDEPVTIFSKEQGIAVFHFGPTFPSYEDFRTCFIDAEDFLVVGDSAFSDNAFVGLFDCLREQGEDVIDATDDFPGLPDAEGGFLSAMPIQQVAVGAGVATHAPGEVFHFAQDLFALGFAILATAGVAEGDDELVEIVEELVRSTTRHAVFDAVFANATDRLEKGAAAVTELNPVDGKVDVGAVAGGVIPDTEEVDGCFIAEEVECSFKYGIVLIWSGSGFLEKHREGFVEGVGAEDVFGPVHRAFAGCLDLVEVFKKAEPLLQRAVSEGDFQSSDRSASFVCSQDANAKSAAGVVDKCPQTFLKGIVVLGLPTTFFESFA